EDQADWSKRVDVAVGGGGGGRPKLYEKNPPKSPAGKPTQHAIFDAQITVLKKNLLFIRPIALFLFQLEMPSPASSSCLSPRFDHRSDHGQSRTRAPRDRRPHGLRDR